MARIVLSALLKPFRGGVEGRVAEFPDIKTKSWSISEAVSKLRNQLMHRMRRTKVDTNCSGQPVSPVPKNSSGAEISVAIEIKTGADPRPNSGFSSEGARQ